MCYLLGRGGQRVIKWARPLCLWSKIHTLTFFAFLPSQVLLETSSLMPQCWLEICTEKKQSVIFFFLVRIQLKTMSLSPHPSFPAQNLHVSAPCPASLEQACHSELEAEESPLDHVKNSWGNSQSFLPTLKYIMSVSLFTTFSFTNFSTNCYRHSTLLVKIKKDFFVMFSSIHLVRVLFVHLLALLQGVPVIDRFAELHLQPLKLVQVLSARVCIGGQPFQQAVVVSALLGRHLERARLQISLSLKHQHLNVILHLSEVLDKLYYY